MEYRLSISGKRTFTGVHVVHNDEDIYFKGANRTNGGSSDENLFEFLNDFFSGLPKDTVETHWEHIKSAKRILEPGYFNEAETEEVEEIRNNNLDYRFLCDRIMPILMEMYRNITPEAIAYAASYEGRLTPPHDLTDATAQSDYPEETTICNDKYRHLAELAFIAQLMYPVVNQLLDHVQIISGKEFRDAVVGEMVSRLKCIVYHPGYRVLDTYVRYSISRPDNKRSSTVVNSEIKYVDHIVYKGLFNKLSLTYIPSKIKGKNLSNELNSLVSSEGRAENDIKFKSFNDPKPTGEDISVQEGYNIIQEHNESDEVAQAEFFTFGLIYEPSPGVFKKRQKGFFTHQCQALGIKNQEMAEKIYNALPTSWEFRLTSVHIKLLQLVFPVTDIEYGIYDALDYDQLMAAGALAQTMLYELGFERLAAVVFAVRNDKLRNTLVDDAYRLNKREREQLLEICTLYQGQQTGTTDNLAVISLSKFLDDLASSAWETNIEMGLLGNQKYLDMMSPDHRYPLEICPEIKTEMLQLTVLRNQAKTEVL